MTDRMLVVAVRQRSHQGPAIAAGREHRQVLADVDAGRLRRDRLELAANGIGRHRLGIEAVVLGQSARQEDIDDRTGADRRHAGRSVRLAQRRDMVHPQAQQSDGACLQRGASRELGMSKSGVRKILHVVEFRSRIRK